MKKALFVILVFALVMAPAFAGGGQQGKQTNAAGYTGNLPYVEFDWYLGFDAYTARDLPMVNDAVNAYIGPKLNAKVNIHFMPPAEWESRMTVMVTSGQDLGIIGFGSQSKLDYLIQAQRGSFYPIEKLLDQYGQKTKALFNKGVWDAMTINNHIYGIPSLKDNCYIISLIYNDDMAKKLGIDMSKAPFTSGYYKMENWLNEAKAKRDQVYGKLEEPLFGNYTYFVMPMQIAVNTLISGENFMAVTNIDGIMDVAGYDSKTVFNLYATKEYRDFCHAQWRMVQKNILAYDYTDKEAEWQASGNMLFFVGWGYTYMPEHLYGDKFVTKMIEPARVWTDTNSYYSSGTAISANSKNPERLMMFLEMVNNDPKLATMMRFGVEGQHYIRDSQGKMQLGPRNQDPANRGYLQWYGAPIGNLTIVEAPESYSGPNNAMFPKMAQYNREAKQPAHMGFSFNTQPVSNQMAACSNVLMEYRDTLNNGRAGSEAEVDRLIDEFNAKLKANGLDKILAEAQKQADAFLASRR